MKMNEKWIDSWIEKKMRLEDAHKEIVVFGINQGTTLLINLFTMLLISLAIDFLKKGILFLILFIPLRSFAGGYHAKTKKGCFIISNALYFCFLVLCKNAVPNNYIVFIGSAMFAAVIASLAPIDSSNKRMGINMSQKMKVRTVFVLVVEIVAFDAYQCKRCVYDNKSRTGEYGVPSSIQCKKSHIERAVSIGLRDFFTQNNIYSEYLQEISELDYEDPMYKLNKLMHLERKDIL